MTPEETLEQYESEAGNVEQVITDTITEAYQDLEPYVRDIRTFENQQLPGFYGSFSGYGMGTGAADLSPAQRMQVASRNVGNLATSAQVARDILANRKKSMNDLISQGMNSWQLGYGAAQNAYDRWWARKQHEDALAMQRARMGGGGGSGTPTPPQNLDQIFDMGGGPARGQVDPRQQAAEQAIRAARDMTRNFVRGSTGISGGSGYGDPVVRGARSVPGL